jgi:non-specific serine/threonine protein kinase
LPAQATALIGRGQDIAGLCQVVLADEGRLVTLTGVGGCGKTRLALGVASALTGSFRDGVWLVALAPVADPLLVPQTVASVLGVRESSDRSLLDGLVAHLSRRELLLVLDNCEHLLTGCAELADALLQGCPRLRLLTTSREPLHISGERAWRVPSLAVPDPRAILPLDELTRFPALQLFFQRAHAVQADFVVTPRNAQVVATICARLEGLPLAIELAAPWVRALSVEQILERLDNAFGLLVGGSRSAPSRQQTMRATLDWSFGLLAERERVVFRRLSAFAGGCGLEAAEAVCSEGGDGPNEVLTLLTRLVDASLVQVAERAGRARYRLLEPVRQYAHERLAASVDMSVVRRQHAIFFSGFAQQWETDANVGGSGRAAALLMLEGEQDNLRAAMRWCVEEGDAETGFALSRAHWNLWVVRGLFTEGSAWLAQLIALPAATQLPTMRAIAQSETATLALRQASYVDALDMYREAMPILRRTNDPLLIHNALADLGYIALHQGNYATAQTHFDEALTIARAAGQRVDEAIELGNLVLLALLTEDYGSARAQAEECLGVARVVGDTWTEANVLNNLGRVALRQGDLVTARRLVSESLVLRRQMHETFELAQSLEALGLVATAEGNYAEAGAALHECLQLRQDLGDKSGAADSLEGIAALLAAENQPLLAVQLAGAAASARQATGAALTPMGRAMLDDWLEPLRQSLGAEAVMLAWKAGHAQTFDQTIKVALATAHTEPAGSTRSWTGAERSDAVLSPRERHVAMLLAQGLTNRQIAERLVITERTVGAHIEHILDKLGFASRHQVGVWATEHGIQ